MFVEYVFCPALGHWVHPDDYTDGINDLENIMREEARDCAQEAADWWEDMEAATAWYFSTEFIGVFWDAQSVEHACWRSWWTAGDDVPF